jgi:hypothetical protein
MTGTSSSPLPVEVSFFLELPWRRSIANDLFNCILTLIGIEACSLQPVLVDEVGAHAGAGGLPPALPEDGSASPVEIVLRNSCRMIVRSMSLRLRRDICLRWWSDDPGSQQDAGVAGGAGYTEMRKGLNSLALVVQEVLRRDHQCGPCSCSGEAWAPWSNHLVIMAKGMGVHERLQHGCSLWPSLADPV